MATITIRNLPEQTKRNLRIRAAENGNSMEEEARSMLEHAVSQPRVPSANKSAWVDEIRALFTEIGDIELELPPRQPMEPSIDFSGPEYDS